MNGDEHAPTGHCGGADGCVVVSRSRAPAASRTGAWREPALGHRCTPDRGLAVGRTRARRGPASGHRCTPDRRVAAGRTEGGR